MQRSACVCAFVCAFKLGTLTIVCGWGEVLGFILCTKPMRTSLKKLCPNIGRTMRGPRLKVFTHEWVGVCVKRIKLKRKIEIMGIQYEEQQQLYNLTVKKKRKQKVVLTQYVLKSFFSEGFPLLSK